MLERIAAAYRGTESAARALLKKAGIEERARIYRLDPVLGTSVRHQRW